MNVKSLGANKTVITLTNGDSVFVSYETPVAAYTKNGYFKTAKHWSATTTKHINSWLRTEGQEPQHVNTIEQEMLDGMLQVVN